MNPLKRGAPGILILGNTRTRGSYDEMMSILRKQGIQKQNVFFYINDIWSEEAFRSSEGYGPIIREIESRGGKWGAIFDKKMEIMTADLTNKLLSREGIDPFHGPSYSSLAHRYGSAELRSALRLISAARRQGATVVIVPAWMARWLKQFDKKNWHVRVCAHTPKSKRSDHRFTKVYVQKLRKTNPKRFSRIRKIIRGRK